MSAPSRNGRPGRIFRGSVRRVVRLAICALGALMAAVTAAHAQAPLDRSVSDSGGRFTVTVPAAWRVQQNSPGVALLGVAPPRRGELVPVNVNVVIDALPAPMTAAAYAAKAAVTLEAQLHGYKVVQQGDTVIDGRPVSYRYYTWVRSDGVGLYQVQVYVTVNQRGFVVTGTTENTPARIRRDVPILVEIIDTFRAKAAPATHAAIDVPGVLATGTVGIPDAGQMSPQRVGLHLVSSRDHRRPGPFARRVRGSRRTVQAGV